MFDTYGAKCLWKLEGGVKLVCYFLNMNTIYNVLLNTNINPTALKTQINDYGSNFSY